MTKNIGFMIYGKSDSDKSIYTEEKYKYLAEHFSSKGIPVKSIIYNNNRAETLKKELLELDTLLVWVNPIEEGHDRSVLDHLLNDLITKGVAVSSKPDTILKIGTKRILFETKDMDWGSDVRLYSNVEDFKQHFPDSLKTGTRVLKQYRGDSGKGIYKVSLGHRNEIRLLPALRGSQEEYLSYTDFFTRFKGHFADNHPMIDQEWSDAITNGMVRCYLSGQKVAGFGYQEIVALYPSENNQIAPSKRYYYTENCGLFADLKQLMEEKWVRQLMQRYQLNLDDLPLIWDADFFINDVYSQSLNKYSLCEINVSCVSPFPESAIPYIYKNVIGET